MDPCVALHLVKLKSSGDDDDELTRPRLTVVSVPTFGGKSMLASIFF
jgi:hypothetical protein